MKYSNKTADKILCSFLGISLQDTLKYETLFTIIDFIEEKEHPNFKGYKFVFNMDNKRVWINMGENTNGLKGYFVELFPFPDYRIDAIRKVLFEWINWYNDLSS